MGGDCQLCPAPGAVVATYDSRSVKRPSAPITESLRHLQKAGLAVRYGSGRLDDSGCFRTLLRMPTSRVGITSFRLVVRKRGSLHVLSSSKIAWDAPCSHTTSCIWPSLEGGPQRAHVQEHLEGSGTKCR